MLTLSSILTGYHTLEKGVGMGGIALILKVLRQCNLPSVGLLFFIPINVEAISDEA